MVSWFIVGDDDECDALLLLLEDTRTDVEDGGRGRTDVEDDGCGMGKIVGHEMPEPAAKDKKILTFVGNVDGRETVALLTDNDDEVLETVGLSLVVIKSVAGVV